MIPGGKYSIKNLHGGALLSYTEEPFAKKTSWTTQPTKEKGHRSGGEVSGAVAQPEAVVVGLGSSHTCRPSYFTTSDDLEGISGVVTQLRAMVVEREDHTAIEIPGIHIYERQRDAPNERKRALWLVAIAICPGGEDSCDKYPSHATHVFIKRPNREFAWSVFVLYSSHPYRTTWKNLKIK